MRSVTYAGETVHTTDEIAEVLVKLTAAVAKMGNAEAVSIPVLDSRTGEEGVAQLVIGVGNDVLSAPTTWEPDGDVPSFDDEVRELNARLEKISPTPRDFTIVDDDTPRDDLGDLDFPRFS
jgi:antitoxin component of MazEF toxin-antitoxin module